MLAVLLWRHWARFMIYLVLCLFIWYWKHRVVMNILLNRIPEVPDNFLNFLLFSFSNLFFIDYVLYTWDIYSTTWHESALPCLAQNPEFYAKMNTVDGTNHHPLCQLLGNEFSTWKRPEVHQLLSQIKHVHIHTQINRMTRWQLGKLIIFLPF